MSETWNSGIRVASLTDVGMRRANNQDSFAAVPADNPERYARRGHLFIVADGMGAHAAGELASRMAAEKIAQYYLTQSPLDAITALRLAVQEANADIHRRGQENPEFHNMGTTASTIAMGPQGVIVAHVGDSRVYRLRDGKLEQLTFDHSLVWEMQASGQLNPNSNLRHNIPKNVITRSLGPSEEVVVDMEGPFPVKKGDYYLLCSDGLTGQVEDEEIGPLLEALPPDMAARVLVDLANLRGGPDNTTMIIVQVTDEPDLNGAKKLRTTDPSPAVPWLVTGTAIFCAVAGAILGFFGYIGPMIVAILLALIAAGVAVYQYRLEIKNNKSFQPARKHIRSAPYRTYSAKPSETLVKRLGDVLVALRNATAERKWLVDWAQVDQLEAEAAAARQRNDLRGATAKQAEAIIQTMTQLRQQNRRPPENETNQDHVLH